MLLHDKETVLYIYIPIYSYTYIGKKERKKESHFPTYYTYTSQRRASQLKEEAERYHLRMYVCIYIYIYM